MTVSRIPSVEGGIQPTIVDAKGDLIVATGNDSPNRLAVGANNLVLTADSAQATGVKWAAPDPLTTKGDLFTYSTTEARLGVGANDTVLTADSTAATGLKWATPSSGGMTLLSTTTLSGASTTISSIAQTYNSLVAYIYATNVSTGAILRIGPNAATTGCAFSASNDGTTGVFSDYNTYFQPMGNASLVTGQSGVFTLTINNYSSTTTWKPMSAYGSIYFTPVGGQAGLRAWGSYLSTTAISSLVFSLSTGTFSAGTVLLYGVK